MSDMETTVLLIRHGETEWNAAGRVQGQTNSDLTELGQRQARAAARFLAEDRREWGLRRPSALYSSDLDRAVQTAEPIGRALGLSSTTDVGLREMNFGRLEGLTWPEVEAEFPQLRARLWGDPIDPHAIPPEGESRAQMHARGSRAIEAIARRHPGETVALVSHGGLIGYFFRGVVAIGFDHPAKFSTLNGSIAAFRFDGVAFQLRAWGLLPSLEAP